MGRRLTLAAWVHAPEHFAQLLSLNPACGCKLSAPLEDKQKGRVTANLLFTRRTSRTALRLLDSTVQYRQWFAAHT